MKEIVLEHPWLSILALFLVLEFVAFVARGRCF